MRQTATYHLPSPWRQIVWSYVMLAAAMTAALLCDWGCSAHAGQLSSDDSSRPSIRYTRRMTRITVLKPVRAHGRARAGYPMAQTLKYTAGTAFRVSGLLNPINWFLR